MYGLLRAPTGMFVAGLDLARAGWRRWIIYQDMPTLLDRSRCAFVGLTAAIFVFLISSFGCLTAARVLMIRQTVECTGRRDDGEQTELAGRCS